MHNLPREDFVNTSLINDMLHVKSENPEFSLFASIELNSILENVCVN